MAHTKQTMHKSKPITGLATYQGGMVSSSSEEQEMEPTVSGTPGERESSKQTEQPRTSRKRKRGDRTASSSLSSADHTRKSRKVAVEYSTDETDEDKIPDMEEGMAFPRKMKNGQVDPASHAITGPSGKKLRGMVRLLRHVTWDASCLG